MPFKIVQTIEEGEICLTAVPHQWEEDGIYGGQMKSQMILENKRTCGSFMIY